MPFGSTAAKDAFLDLTLGPAQATGIPDPFWLALFVGDPTNTGIELAFARGYLRVAIPKSAWTASVEGLKATNADVTFPQAIGGDWATVTHVGLYDAASVGTLYDVVQLPVSVTILVGSTLVFRAGTITVTQS